jgi:hypothetical protein
MHGKYAKNAQDRGNENNPRLQRASRGHLIAFTNPMRKVRERFLSGALKPGPVPKAELAGADPLLKFAIVMPGWSKKNLKRRLYKDEIFTARGYKSGE